MIGKNYWLKKFIMCLLSKHCFEAFIKRVLNFLRSFVGQGCVITSVQDILSELLVTKEHNLTRLG
jgi:hypothetical protein